MMQLAIAECARDQGARNEQRSTLSGQSSNANGNYAFGVTAIRLNVTAGSSIQTTTMTLIQV
jgi:hypothetical protein